MSERTAAIIRKIDRERESRDSWEPLTRAWYDRAAILAADLAAAHEALREAEERAATAENRLRHSEFHRSHNRRSMRERGKLIVTLTATIERQRAELRAAQVGGKRRLSGHTRAAELHRSLRQEDVGT